MAIHSPIQPVLHPAKIRQLRPTQMTAGMREVERKRSQWRDRPRDEAGNFLGAHMVPVVVGPDGHRWLVDQHHLVLALHLDGVEDVLVSVIAVLDHLPRKRFFAFIDSRNWLHPYDAEGRRQDWTKLPRHVHQLDDDPYRSLAGEVRRAGGYAKSPVPYTEFLWADFFRDRIGSKLVTENFPKALTRAVGLARCPDARHLPGWAGAVEQC